MYGICLEVNVEGSKKTGMELNIENLHTPFISVVLFFVKFICAY